MKLYVGNLPWETTSDQLQDLFRAHGTVLSARVLTDRETGKSRGFGFVEMSSRAEGEAACASLNGRDMGSRRLLVNEARPLTERGAGSGFAAPAYPRPAFGGGNPPQPSYGSPYGDRQFDRRNDGRAGGRNRGDDRGRGYRNG